MKPFDHAQLSVKKYGGTENDYQKIHDFFDQTKAHHADMRHRAILHNSWGIFLCEQFFGTTITNSDGHEISVRDIAEDHVLQDLGRIPSLDEMINLIPITEIDKLSKNETKNRKLSFNDFEKAFGVSNDHQGEVYLD
jgi:hypothetical protein